MCGIAGIIGKEQSMEPVLRVLKHRGPDASGIWKEDAIQLGHTRLSIIDLSDDANQPFVSDDERYILVFNGEIYNYKELRSELEKHFVFRTQSDTEVLLNAYRHWGKDMLERLNGMFAFAIWDKQRKKLFAARDRFGVKPFYYAIYDGALYFASEIKALWAAGIPKKPDEKVWSAYFQYGSYGIPDETFWEGIKQIPGGHYLEFSPGSGEMEIGLWYDFVKRVNNFATLPYDEVKKIYEELITESIRLRFRADVPVGFNLSGGLDSSTLLAYVNLLYGGGNIEAYTFYTGDDRYDELPWVEQMVALTGNPLHKVKLSPELAPGLIEEMAYIQDEPYGGLPTVAYGNLFREARNNGTYVLLDGQGMDEQWAGYDYYIKQDAGVIQGVNKSPLRPGVLKPEFKTLAEKPVYPQPFDDRLKNLQYRDLFFTKIPRALRFNDRASMKSSVELREPFLDYRMVEWAFVQPQEYKISNGVRKYLLRDLVRKHLGEALSFAPKRPLQTPQREWLGDELRNFTEEKIRKLLDSSVKNWFNKDALWQEWKQYREGDRDSSFHIWQWMNTAMLL